MIKNTIFYQKSKFQQKIKILFINVIFSWISKFNTNAGRMTRAFQRTECGFYDSAMLPHGGPDPSPNLRPGGRPRNRRQAEDSYEGSDGSLLRYDKNNPMTGIKQITTGYRKWAQRQGCKIAYPSVSRKIQKNGNFLKISKLKTKWKLLVIW